MITTCQWQQWLVVRRQASVFLPFFKTQVALYKSSQRKLSIWVHLITTPATSPDYFSSTGYIFSQCKIWNASLRNAKWRLLWACRSSTMLSMQPCLQKERLYLKYDYEAQRTGKTHKYKRTFQPQFVSTDRHTHNTHTCFVYDINHMTIFKRHNSQVRKWTTAIHSAASSSCID